MKYYLSKSNPHIVSGSIEGLNIRGIFDAIEIEGKDRFDAQCMYYVRNFEQKNNIKFLWWENNKVGFKAVFENNQVFYFSQIIEK